MDIYFAGAENPTLRRRLYGAGVRTMAMSFWGLSDRLPKRERWEGWLKERLSDDVDVLLDGGGASARKDPGRLNEDEWVEYYNDLMDFCEVNQHRLGGIVEFDAWSWPDIQVSRTEFWDGISGFIPVWRPDYGYDDLEATCARYDKVAVSRAALDADEHLAPRLNALIGRYGTEVLGLGTFGEGHLVRFGAITTTVWTSPMRNGETIAWENGRLVRYSRHDKDSARRALRPLLEREGFDADAIAADDPEELTRFTVWSLTQWAASTSRANERRHVSDTRAGQGSQRNAQHPPGEPGTTSVEALKPDGRQMLPILERLATTRRVERDGEMVEVADESVGITGKSLRQCDTCFIKTYCPAYTEGSACAYEIPVEVKTKDQLVALMQALLEMQSQRVLFARFAEELEGGMPTKTVSQELDRFFDITEKAKSIQDDRDFLRMTVETRSGAGVLSRLFGDSVGTQARALEAPVEADEYIAEVLDVE